MLNAESILHFALIVLHFAFSDTLCGLCVAVVNLFLYTSIVIDCALQAFFEADGWFVFQQFAGQ